MNELELNSNNSQVGFRLQYMELLNWGTFHDKIWRIEPQGNNSLLTGSIGSGKSTIVDALTCLIVPHQKITFNKAANPESKERSIPSYIKGEYKRERDDYDTKGKAITLRYTSENYTPFSIILANFNNTGYESNITLAVVFWLKDNQHQKILLISKKPLTIKGYFTNFEDPTELKKRLKAFDFIELFDDNFSQYSQRFRHLFGMNSDKAIDLFYQTVSMKSVKSLTEFVREQMLERTEIKNQIDELRKRFEDLNKAYTAVQEARKQRDILKPLVELSESFRKHEERVQEIDNIVQSIPSYFASKKIGLLEEEIIEYERKLNQLNNQLLEIGKSLKEKRGIEYQINQDIDNNGGKRLREIDNGIEQKEKLRDDKKEKHKKYSELTSLCDLPTANTEQTFYKNLKTAEQKIGEIETRQQEILGEHGRLSGKKTLIEENIELESKELDSLKSRVNQIPLEILNIRGKLASSLQIDEEEIPFAGELLKVNENEKDWEGAIERLLRSFGISMLVPDKYYRQISEYVNVKRLTDNKDKGMRFEYYKVPHNYKLNNNREEINLDSVVNKIEIKPNTPYKDWLQNELLKRFNLRCVSLEEFQRQSDVITKEGQFKTGYTRHIKDDRKDLWDRRNFVLGWTNTEKIKAIEKHLNELQIETQEIDTVLNNLKMEIAKNNTLITNLNLIKAFKNWNELNWQDEVKKIEDLKREKYDLESSNNILKTLQEKLNAAKDEIVILESNQESKREEIGNIKGKIARHRADKENCINIKDLFPEDEAAIYYPKIDELIIGINLTIKNIDTVAEEFKIKFIGKNGEKENLNEKIKRVREKIIQMMKDYKTAFPSESLDLTIEVEARSEYLTVLEKIISDGLPNHEARFKKMLNENTINDIVAFDNKLDTHSKQIKKKIEEINKHLREIEYNKGTYIALLAIVNSDKEIRDFKQELKECYSNYLGMQDAYTEDRFNQVKKILDRFSSNESREIEWTNKVTDVRNWFIFNASEKYLETNEEKEFYAGTLGKSGGQKEKLAYTILASALAYQFGLSYGEPKSKSFRFVVIDEAFGRGDDESTQFGLGLFKKLNLQLLIVTPLQKIHVIENYINAVHYVSNINGNNSEIQNLTVEEYKKEKYLYNNLASNKIEVLHTN